MKEETKLITGVLGGFCLLAVAACAVEVYAARDLPNTCSPIFAHIDLHCDRPIEEVIKECDREKETESEKFDREYRESEKDSDFGRMS